MRKSPLTPFIGLAGLILAGLGAAGCGGGSIGPGGNTTSQVRSFNGLQGCSTPVDIEQIGVLPAQFSSGFGATPAGYAAIRAGNGLHYGVFASNTTTNPIATSDVDLSPHDPGGNANSGTYTLVASGVCGTSTGTTAPRLLRLIDAFPSNFSGTNNGTVALRVINLVPDLSGGVTLASNGLPLNGNNNEATNNVPYAGESGFNSSTYTTNINPAGNPTLTVRTNANAVLATVPNFTFTPNHAYTLFVIGEATPVNGGTAIRVVPVQDF